MKKKQQTEWRPFREDLPPAFAPIKQEIFEQEESSAHSPSAALDEVEDQRWYKSRMLKTTVILFLAAIVSWLAYLSMTGSKEETLYKRADKLMQASSYQEAAVLYNELGSFQDSPSRKQEALYQEAIQLTQAGEFKRGRALFSDLRNYKDAKERLHWVDYQEALFLAGQKNYEGAQALFAKLGSYSDSAAQYKALELPLAMDLLRQNHFYDAALLLLPHRTEPPAQSTLLKLLGNQLHVLAAGNHITAAISRDGKVTMLGHVSNPRNWESLANDRFPAVSLAVAKDLLVKLNPNGKVDVQSENKALKTEVESWSEIAAISASDGHVLGLHTDGSVVAAGNTAPGTEAGTAAAKELAVQNWKNIVSIAAGPGRSLGITQDGRVLATGQNDKGQLDVGDWTDMSALACGHSFTLGLKTDGSCVVAGDIYENVSLPAWTNALAIAAGDEHAVALLADGSVAAVGNNFNGQLETSSWQNIVAIAAGSIHTVGQLADGRLIAVGATQSLQERQVDVSAVEGVGLPVYQKRSDTD